MASDRPESSRRVTQALGPRAYEGSFFFLTLNFARRLREAMAEEFADLGISVPEYTAIMVLNSEGPLSNAALARHCSMTPQAMMKITTRLMDADIIRRADGGPNREHLLEFTDKGEAFVEAIIERLRALAHRLTRNSSHEEYLEFKRLLRVFRNELGPASVIE